MKSLKSVTYHNYGWSSSVPSKFFGSPALEILKKIIIITSFIVLVKLSLIYSSGNQSLGTDLNKLQVIILDFMEGLTWLVCPLLTGALTTMFSWAVLYLDSNKPGIDPPLPFSPQRIRHQSGHTFHLQYLFTLYLGVLVSAVMIHDGFYLNNNVVTE